MNKWRELACAALSYTVSVFSDMSRPFPSLWLSSLPWEAPTSGIKKGPEGP